MSHKKTILNHLEQKGGLSTIHAAKVYFISCLRDQIYLIRKERGYDFIDSKKCYNKNTKTHYTVYTLGTDK